MDKVPMYGYVPDPEEPEPIGPIVQLSLMTRDVATILRLIHQERFGHETHAMYLANHWAYYPNAQEDERRLAMDNARVYKGLVESLSKLADSIEAQIDW